MNTTRRNALATIATTSTLGLAGCANSIPGQSSNNEIGIRTGDINAESFDNAEFTVEVTGLGDSDAVSYGIQTNLFYEDGWIPTGDALLRRLDRATQPGEYAVPFQRTVQGGGEYQYRAVVTVDGDDVVYGDTKNFTLQDLDLPAPELDFGDASLNEEAPVSVDIPVENVSDVMNGSVSGTVRWFDADETYLGNSYGGFRLLRPGERGVIRLSSDGDDINQRSVADYEYGTRYNPVYSPAEGVEIVSRSGVTGTARTTVSDPPRSVTFVVRYFNSDGVVIGDVSDDVGVPDLEEGSEWTFELNGQGEIAGEVDYSEIVLLKN